MTLAEYEVLLHLSEAPDHRLRMNELADLARLSPSGLTRRFDALVRRDWVVRERCDDDRRGVLAALTAEGLKQLKAATPVHTRGEREYFFDALDAKQPGVPRRDDEPDRRDQRAVRHTRPSLTRPPGSRAACRTLSTSW